MYNQDRYQRARHRVQQIRGFYIHLIVYLLVNGGLFLLDLLISPGTFWFYWPLLGWGIGLVVHVIAVFGAGHWFGHAWEEREIRRIMDKEQ